MFKRVLKTSFSRLIPVIVSGSKEVVLLYVLLYPISLYLNIQMEGVSIPSPDMEMQRIIVMFTNALFEYFTLILKSILVIHIVFRLTRSQAKEEKHLFTLFGKYFLQVLVERLRCVYAIAWRTVLLIVPGVLEYIRLLFIDQVVLLSRSYHNGDVDALEKSRTLSKKQMGQLFLAWVFFLALFVVNTLIVVNVLPNGAFQHFMLYTGGYLIDVLTIVFMASYFLEVIEQTDLIEEGKI